MAHEEEKWVNKTMQLLDDSVSISPSLLHRLQSIPARFERHDMISFRTLWKLAACLVFILLMNVFVAKNYMSEEALTSSSDMIELYFPQSIEIHP